MKYLLAIIFLCSGFSQNNQNLIYWSENIKLEWKDFKAPPENHPTHKAMSSLSLSIGMDLYTDSIVVVSKSTFDRAKSWVKSDWQMPRVLDHEQIHFDIRELYTRRLKNAISVKQFKRKTAQTELSSMIRDANIQYGKAQNQYDQESYTSEDKQNDWKTRVDQELKSLNTFQNPRVKIILTN